MYRGINRFFDRWSMLAPPSTKSHSVSDDHFGGQCKEEYFHPCPDSPDWHLEPRVIQSPNDHLKGSVVRSFSILALVFQVRTSIQPESYSLNHPRESVRHGSHDDEIALPGRKAGRAAKWRPRRRPWHTPPRPPITSPKSLWIELGPKNSNPFRAVHLSAAGAFRGTINCKARGIAFSLFRFAFQCRMMVANSHNYFLLFLFCLIIIKFIVTSASNTHHISITSNTKRVKLMRKHALNKKK